MDRECSDEIRRIRRKLHQNPELGRKEYQTAEFIEYEMNKLNIKTCRFRETAVMGMLQGGCEGPTAAIRADMDGLPLQEKTKASFTSKQPDIMHACGHDVHMAAALGAARILAAEKDRLKGNVVFLFQPDEEGRGGAEDMVSMGCMKGVDAVFGAHVSPELPEGHIGVRYGKFYAASDMFEVEVRGISSHGAMREKGIDALEAAARMVTELLALPAKVTGDPCVLTVGKLQSGSAGNILPGEADFEGIIRTLGPVTRAAMEEAFRETIASVAAQTKTKTEIHYRHSHPGIVNDDRMTQLVEKTSERILGKEYTHRLLQPVMMTEDFGYFLEKTPGSYFHIGAGCNLPLHHPGFLPAEEVAVKLARLHAALVKEFLNKR